MDKLRALQYFVASAEEGSFAGAGRRLAVSVPAVQKLINSLESSLGVRLFERTAKGVSLTASGHVYLESCQPLLADLEVIDETVSRSARRPVGTVVVGVHAQLAHPILLPALPRLHALYPDILIDLRVVNRIADADANAVDVFLVHGWPDADDLVHLRLGHSRSLVLASPRYWSAHEVPREPADLARHVCLLMRNPNGTLLDLWEFERSGEKVAVTVNGWFNSNAREILLDAVLAGEGVGRFNEVTTRAHLQAGRLVPALIDWEVVGGPPVNLLYRPSQRRVPRVRLFIDFVTALFEGLQRDGDSAMHRLHPERPYWHRNARSRASSVLARTR